jgi:uncharacterized protein
MQDERSFSVQGRTMKAAFKSLAAAGLLCAAAAQAGEMTRPEPASPAHPERRAVVVSGEGEVSAAPDRARIAMAAEETKPDLKAAQADVNRIVRDYLAQARALGVKDEDISTAGLSIRADYDYSSKDGRKFVGYHVTRNIVVVVRELDKIGDYLQKATDAGINNVSDPVLESSQAPELQRKAMAKAAADAQARARVLAETLGVKLGTVHTINAAAEVTPPRPLMRTMAMAAPAQSAPNGNEEMGFAAGEIRFHSTLTADFDLVP